MKARTGSRQRSDHHGRCSFCGKSRDEAVLLIAGQCALICQACVVSTHGFLRAEVGYRYPAWLGRRPAEIKAALDEAVIGQEHAKRVLSVALYNHYKRLAHRRQRDTEIGKANVLLLGGAGTGKTLLARTLAAIAEVPFIIADATTLTEAGYIGDDVESILFRLLQAADFDIEEAQAGISRAPPSRSRPTSADTGAAAFSRSIRPTFSSSPAALSPGSRRSC